MGKVKIDTNACLYPMPMTLVGATVGDRPNFLAVAWAARVNFRPPLIGVALGKIHHTNAGIHENKAFSVNIPGRHLMEKTDYCGIITGKTTDKTKLFEVFYGEFANAPMIRECPLCFECRLVQAVDLPSNTLFIGEIVSAYADEGVLTNGQPDLKKIDPFTLTMPDNFYWSVGEKVGQAWNAGKSLKSKV
jgi:flavin reductase (DIM6/NTAB) family NADH-FMN oxidoreductase RutF